MRTLLMIAASLSLAACGDRPITPGDGGQLDVWRPGRDVSYRPPLEQGPLRDACVRPPGFCSSIAQCAAGEDCTGCYADPCCPMCEICLRKCTPVSPAGCSSNGQCSPASFCNLDGKCSSPGALGQCQPRPGGCPKIYSPVCGCDGKTYGNDCEAHAAGVSVGFKGKCCKDLDLEYVSLVLAAKKCCALCDRANPCTLLVSGSLACPCPTSVNAFAPELAQIKLLTQQWAAQACPVIAGCSCLKVIGGSCLPAPGGSGLCTDQTP